MSDEKISAMPDAGVLQSGDQIPLVRSGGNFSTTPSRVAAYTGVSAVASGVASLSTGLFTANSSLGSLSTGLSTTKSGVTSNSSQVTSLSTGLSTALSSVTSLSTSTSTAIASISGGGASYTPPILSAFTYANQPPGATATAITGGIQLYSPSLSSTFNLNLLLESAPSAPYTKWLRLTSNLNPAVEYSDFGMAFADGSGRILAFEFFAGAGTPDGGLTVTNYDIDGSRSSFTPYADALPPLIGVHDDGTNLNFLFSFDGVTSFLYESVSRTAWLTGGPTEIGFFTNGYAQPIIANFSHWGPNLPGPI